MNMGCAQSLNSPQLSEEPNDAESTKSTKSDIAKDEKQLAQVLNNSNSKNTTKSTESTEPIESIPDHITERISWELACNYLKNQHFEKFDRDKESAILYQNFRNNVVSKYVSGKHEVLHSEFSWVGLIYIVYIIYNQYNTKICFNEVWL